MTLQRICDFCVSEGKNSVLAVGWYHTLNGNQDVCEKCATDAEKQGCVINYY